MSVIFSDNFDDPVITPGGYNLAAGWNHFQTLTLREGGCGWGDGIDVGQKRFFISCQTGNSYHDFTATPTVSFRAQMAFKANSGSLTWESAFLWAPSGALNGFVFILILRGNGQISIRMNNVVSETLSPSATGVFPADGTPFALQWRMVINSSSSVSVAVDINNSTVWTHTYTDTDNVIGTPQWSGGCGANFNRVSLLPISFGSSYNTAFDELEIDDSNASVSWPVCSEFTPLGAAKPAATTTGLFISVGSQSFTIHGNNFRIINKYGFFGQILPFIRIKDPLGNTYNNQAGDLTGLSVSPTVITGTMPVVGTAGTWCVLVINSTLCWEVTASEVETCYAQPAVAPGVAVLLKADTGVDDDGDQYRAYVKTRAIPPSGLITQYGRLQEPFVTARQSGAVLQVVASRDCDLQEQETTIDLSAVGAEDHVVRKAEGTAMADILLAQFQLGDAAPSSQQWSLDELYVPILGEGDR